MTKRVLVGLIVVSGILVVGCALTFKQESTEKEHAVVDLTHKLVASSHYHQLKINDEFSKKAFEQFLKNADPNKRFLLKTDVARLEAYKFNIDDEFQSGNVQSFDVYNEIVEKRERQVAEMIGDILAKPIDVNRTDSLEYDPEKIDFAENKNDLKRKWEQYLVGQVITKMYSIQKKDLENDSVAVKKTKEELEKEAREDVLKKNQDYFKRLGQLERADRFTLFVNSILAIYGPHTEFYPPKDKEDFDISFSGKLEGIGATLTVKDGYIKVSKIVPGSASWKQGDLKEGDLILEVAQGDSLPVDVYDMRLDKAVRLIRGPKGTEVRLTVQKVDGTKVIIPIIRDVVVIEETYAKSLMVKNKQHEDQFGYFNLASFYAEFGKQNGKRCSEDMLLEINKIKASGSKGVIIDLRNNGGGSLQDCIEMVGYFIESGPVVQVDGVGMRPEAYDDPDSKQYYDAPIVVLINNFSASASEIFAAAIQDYNRGIIMGTNSFGKGTVQRFYELKRVADAYGLYSEQSELGNVKQTTAKFFRINGGATQLKGVTPDIVLEDEYSLVEIGEKEYDHALEWSSISPARYQKFKWAYNKDSLKTIIEHQVDTSIYFQSVRKSAQYIKESSDQTKIPLGFEAYVAFQKTREAKADESEVVEVALPDFQVEFTKRDSVEMLNDTITQSRMEKFQKEIQKDPYVWQALQALEIMAH